MLRYTTAHPARLFEARVGLLSDCFHFALPARRAKYGDHSSWQLRALVYFWKSLSCAALRRSFDVARPRTNDMHRHSLKLALQGDKESLAHIRQQQAEEGSDEIQSFNERLRSQLYAHLLDMEAAKSKSLWGFLRVSSRRFFSVFLKLFDAGHAGLSNKIFFNSDAKFPGDSSLWRLSVPISDKRTVKRPRANLPKRLSKNLSF